MIIRENYYITSCGKVINLKTNKPMSTKRVGSGYEGMNLWSKADKKHTTVYIHRLVAMAYLPNPDNLPEVNHKDGNKFNNSVNNLEWCSISYNRRHTRQVLKHNVNTITLTYPDGNIAQYDFCKNCADDIGIKYTTLMNFLLGYRKKPKEIQHIIFEYKGNKI